MPLSPVQKGHHKMPSISEALSAQEDTHLKQKISL